jgi:hypothetical protein
VTDPLGTPTLHTKRLSLPDEIRANYRHNEELCNDPGAVVNFVAPSLRNVQNCAWRNGHLYFAMEDNLADPQDDFLSIAVRWFDVDLNGWPAQNEPTIAQQGLLDGGRGFLDPFNPPPGLTPSAQYGDLPVHYMYPYVMPLASGDIAIYFTRHCAKGYPSLMWTAHRASDPSGQAGAPITLMQAGTSGIRYNYVWGEYEGIALDPVDQNRAWSTGQVGRCCPQQPCGGVPECEDCTNGGSWQEQWHTSIGSYAAPQGPVRTLRVKRQPASDPDPPEYTVKIMPTDVENRGYAALAPDDPEAVRRFGDEQLVHLWAPSPLNPNTLFDHWELDGQPYSSQQLITVTMGSTTDNSALVPVYVVTP